MVSINMFYVYILYCSETDKFYTGYTSNLKRRITEHNYKKVHTTKRLGNPKLIFYEAYLNNKDAIRREKYLKTNNGKRALKLMLKEYLKSKV